MTTPEIQQVTVWRTRDGRAFPTRAEAEEWLKLERLVRWLDEHTNLDLRECEGLALKLLSHFAIVPREPSP